MSSVLNEMGMWQLATRGLGLRIVMVGTLTGLQWGIYDAYKVCSELMLRRLHSAVAIACLLAFPRRLVAALSMDLPDAMS